MAQDAIISISGVTQQLETMALHNYELRHRVIAHNIANVDSVGFQPLRVDFEEQLEPLRAAVREQESPAQIAALISQVHPRVELTAASSSAMSGPGENLDDQLVALTQNTLDYEAMLTVVSRFGSLDRLAISGN